MRRSHSMRWGRASGDQPPRSVASRPTTARRSGAADERGTVLILAALLIPIVLIVGGLGLAGVTAYTAGQDTQRSADLAAVAAAANSPSVYGDGSTLSTPLPQGGTSISPALDDVLDKDDWSQTACAVAGKQFEPGRARIVESFGNIESFPQRRPPCTATWGFENPVTEALALCAADALDADSCAAVLKDRLASGLPLLDEVSDSDISAVESQAATLVDELNTVAAQSRALLDATLLALLADDCLVEDDLLVGSCLLANPLAGTLGDIWDALAIPHVGGTPQLGFDLARLAPALATPRVTVRLHGIEIEPPLVNRTWEVAREAVARRTIKRALVLPTAGIPGADASLAAEWAAHFAGPLGLTVEQAGQIAVQAGVDGRVVDPNHLNPGLDGLLGAAFDLVDTYEDAVRDEVIGALQDAACDGAAPSELCGDVEDPTAPEALMAPFLGDLAEATAPPPAGSAPSANGIAADALEEAVQTGDPILIVAPVATVPFRLLAGESAWSTLTSAIPGLTDVMYLPALDVIPAVVSRPVAGGPYVLEPIVNATDSALATEGLYRGKLVE